MTFEDDNPVSCEYCGKISIPGEKYYNLYPDNKRYCSMFCLAMDNVLGDIKEEKVETKEDKSLYYADLMEGLE